MITVEVPSSKSITNRALIMAALAKGTSTIGNFLESEDTILMKKALESLGVRFEKNGKKLKVISVGRLQKPKAPIFCGNSGTTMRFLTAVLAAQDFKSTVTGNARMLKRPVKDLVSALKKLGAEISYLGKKGFPPLKIQGPFKNSACAIKGGVSSQYLSALLMAAPLVGAPNTAKKHISIKVIGGLVSKPYADMTIKIMRTFGVKVARDGYRKFTVKTSQKYKPKNFEVEGDASSASYFWGIGALTNEKINVTNIPKNSSQADMRFLKYAKYFSKKCLPKKINCQNMPDSAMTLAVLCAFRKGTTLLTGLSTLRVKECDRLVALKSELNKIGCRVTKTNSSLKISGDPKRLHGAKIKTYSDHRMAMCFGMASVFLPNIKIKNPACVKKTYPDFWKDLERVKGNLSEKNIILTGMRGTGKTRLGIFIAKKLKRRFIDIDREIERTASASSSPKTKIAEIVKTRGWKYFRKLESQVARKLRKIKRAVIATGGGTLMNEENVKYLKKNGKVLFLYCPVNILKKRLKQSRNRPSLTGGHFLDELEKIYKKRARKYEQVSDAIINVSKNTSNKKLDFNVKIGQILKALRVFGIR